MCPERVEELPSREALIALAHNFDALRERWKLFAEKAGADFQIVERLDGFPIDCVEFGSGTGGVYISAGIHGDEAAAVVGLLLWAESLLERNSLPGVSMRIFPCLNPWGLLENARRDASGTDLNRVWNKEDHPLVRAVTGCIDACQPALALTLHEDYDANGIYLYELPRKGFPAAGGRLLREVERAGLRRDTRKEIESSKVSAPGLIRRRKVPQALRETLPEALFLFLRTKARVFTFETPSEEALDLRVLAQIRFLDTVIL